MFTPSYWKVFRFFLKYDTSTLQTTSIEIPLVHFLLNNYWIISKFTKNRANHRDWAKPTTVQGLGRYEFSRAFQIPRGKSLFEIVISVHMLVTVLRVQLILIQIRIRILDPHWKKMDPDPNPDPDPDPGYFF